MRGTHFLLIEKSAASETGRGRAASANVFFLEG